jgi:hypothetical protein
MVRVTVELSKLEIEMLINCIDTVIDVKHVKDIERIKEIKNQFSKYL